MLRTSPEALQRLAEDAVTSAQEQIEALVGRSTAEVRAEPVEAVFAIDSISNTLCLAVDWLSLLAATHPEQRVASAADAENNKLMTLLYHLNTHRGLYRVAKDVTGSPETMAKLTPEQARVASLFTEEFERHGVLLEADDAQQLRGLLSQQCGRCRVGLAVPAGLFAMASTSRDAATRAKAFAAYQAALDHNVPVLEELLAVRHATAKLLGKPSYAAFTAEERMLRNPERAQAKLEAVSAKLSTTVQPEIAELLQLKLETEGPSEVTDQLSSDQPLTIPGVDRAHYAAVRREQLGAQSLASQPIAPYLSLRAGLAGVAHVTEQLFGLKLVAATPRAGETVASTVLKFEVLTSDGELVGSMYVDPWPRAGKTGGAVHLNVVSGRSLSTSWLPPKRDACAPDTAFLDLDSGSEAGKYQAPEVALVFNFGHRGVDNDLGASLLSLSELQTLFHEFGHGLHSMMARTQFHHVAGTRVPLDFYARSWPVLSQFCKHYQTGAPLPRELFDAHVAKSLSSQALNEQDQVSLALLDIHLHLAHARADASGETLGPGWSTSLAADVRAKHSAVVCDPASVRHAQFTHLVTYGAAYYSYALCKDLADDAWAKLDMDADPLDRARGRALANAAFIHGNGRDPLTQIGDLGISL
ncbi:intermediate peptidase [Thecamonas trahens ATCC 50062]|uniref:Intermediate peptidase n=1 Tax=Thecamonas trahens ATCC 50062 TaxID=461836 RepID=A0A0L0D7T0_THETB|nr:intermediate peptidase [Thecamonas trahens ATCC 50062]KNC48442.1 intermediate peptidase [Thecamonas trahens ATCC 50062]|eukprot:XP_013758555.1 intermediate peptidase [Thecamonas trahens ATCC 50062]